jgi:hypothetical protein
VTELEALEVVEALIAPYPGPPWDQRSVESWARAIAKTSAGFRPALGVAERWAEANDRLPSLHAFLAAIAPPPPPPAYVAGHDPDEWRPDPDVARRLARTWRGALRAVHGDHDHRTPNPCPVCRGVNPRYADRPTTTPQSEELHA